MPRRIEALIALSRPQPPASCCPPPTRPLPLATVPGVPRPLPLPPSCPCTASKWSERPPTAPFVSSSHVKILHLSILGVLHGRCRLLAAEPVPGPVTLGKRAREPPAAGSAAPSPRGRPPAGDARQVACLCHRQHGHHHRHWLPRHYRYLGQFRATTTGQAISSANFAAVVAHFESGAIFEEPSTSFQCDRVYDALERLYQKGQSGTLTPAWPSDLHRFTVPQKGGALRVEWTKGCATVTAVVDQVTQTLDPADGAPLPAANAGSIGKWVDEVLDHPLSVRLLGCGHLAVSVRAPCRLCASDAAAGVRSLVRDLRDGCLHLAEQSAELREAYLAVSPGAAGGGEGEPPALNNILSFPLLAADWFDNVLTAPNGRRHSDAAKVIALGEAGRGRAHYEAYQQVLLAPTRKTVDAMLASVEDHEGLDVVGFSAFQRRLMGSPSALAGVGPGRLSCILGWDETRVAEEVVVRSTPGEVRTIGLAGIETMSHATLVNREARFYRAFDEEVEFPSLAAELRARAANEVFVIAARGVEKPGVVNTLWKRLTRTETGVSVAEDVQELAMKLAASKIDVVAGEADGHASNRKARALLRSMSWARLRRVPIWSPDGVHLGKLLHEQVMLDALVGNALSFGADVLASFPSGRRAAVDRVGDDDDDDANFALDMDPAKLHRRAVVLAPPLSDDHETAILSSVSAQRKVVEDIALTRKRHEQTPCETIQEYTTTTLNLQQNHTSKIPMVSTFWDVLDEGRSTGTECDPIRTQPASAATPSAGASPRSMHTDQRSAPAAGAGPASQSRAPWAACELFPELLPLIPTLKCPAKFTLVDMRPLLLIPHFCREAPGHNRPIVTEANLTTRTRKDLMSTFLFTDILHPHNIHDISPYIDRHHLPLFIYMMVLGQLFDPRSPQHARWPHRVVNKVSYLHAASPWWAFLTGFTAHWLDRNTRWARVLRAIAGGEWARSTGRVHEVRQLAAFIDKSRPTAIWLREVSQYLTATLELTKLHVPLRVTREQFVEWVFGVVKRTMGSHPGSVALLDRILAQNLRSITHLVAWGRVPLADIVAEVTKLRADSHRVDGAQGASPGGHAHVAPARDVGPALEMTRSEESAWALTTTENKAKSLVRWAFRAREVFRMARVEADPSHKSQVDTLLTLLRLNPDLAQNPPLLRVVKFWNSVLVHYRGLQEDPFSSILAALNCERHSALLLSASTHCVDITLPVSQAVCVVMCNDIWIATKDMAPEY